MRIYPDQGPTLVEPMDEKGPFHSPAGEIRLSSFVEGCYEPTAVDNWCDAIYRSIVIEPVKASRQKRGPLPEDEAGDALDPERTQRWEMVACHPTRQRMAHTKEIYGSFLFSLTPTGLLMEGPICCAMSAPVSEKPVLSREALRRKPTGFHPYGWVAGPWALTWRKAVQFPEGRVLHDRSNHLSRQTQRKIQGKGDWCGRSPNRKSLFRKHSRSSAQRPMMWLRTWQQSAAFLLCLAGAASGAAPGKQERSPAKNFDAISVLRGLPLHFEPHRGHADSDVKFLSRGPGYFRIPSRQ